MKARLSRIRLRDLALFVVVAGVVAVGAVFAAREAGWEGGFAGATGERLSLSLSASQQICETRRARVDGEAESYQDEDGNWVERHTIFGWSRIPSVHVGWRVSGGQEPYTLVIDHESRDRAREYRGASGTAQVGCADASVGTSFDFGYRLYAVDPEVDSGWKTVRAVVTDANGDTAEAATRLYVIRVDAAILTRGETYRVFGHLITAPTTHDLRNGSIADRECDDAGSRCETQIQLALSTTDVEARLYLFLSDGTESGRWQVWSDGTSFSGRNPGPTGAAGGDAVDQAFDAVVESVGAMPRNEGGSP